MNSSDTDYPKLLYISREVQKSQMFLWSFLEISSLFQMPQQFTPYLVLSACKNHIILVIWSNASIFYDLGESRLSFEIFNLILISSSSNNSKKFSLFTKFSFMVQVYNMLTLNAIQCIPLTCLLKLKKQSFRRIVQGYVLGRIKFFGRNFRPATS